MKISSKFSQYLIIFINFYQYYYENDNQNKFLFKIDKN